MGKRKFKKPDDSDSDYEWEEAKPKKIIISDLDSISHTDLEGFLNQYTTKSKSELKSEKVQEEKDKLTKNYEDRIYKPTGSTTNHYDTNWLRKSFNRCKEQSIIEGIDILILLKERYDDKTIDFMLKSFDHGNYKNNRYENQSQSSNYRYENVERYKERANSPKSFNNINSSESIIEERYVTDTDINESCASLMRAEMTGNFTKISKLKKKVETLRLAQQKNLKVRLTRLKKESDDKKEIMIQKTMKSGKMIPYIESANKFISQSRPYDNNNSTISDLIRQEKGIDAEENDLAFAKMSGKVRAGFKTNDDIGDCEYNDVFVDKKVNSEKMLKNEKQKAIDVHKNHTAQVSNCKLCYSKLPKHLVLSKGKYFCLIVPMDLGITDFHLQLVPLDHIAACTHISDDDTWKEMCEFKKTIVEFFSKELKSETIFLETVTKLNSYPHTTIDCIPLSCDRDSYQISTNVFFKKSIDEAKSEWCQNKKLLDIKYGDIRRTVPKVFPYFSVEFDLRSGYAFVIDDENQFSTNFGLEIVGSLLDKDLIEINHRKMKNFNQQADATLKYEKKWKKYDLWKNCDSDDDSD